MTVLDLESMLFLSRPPSFVIVSLGNTVSSLACVWIFAIIAWSSPSPPVSLSLIPSHSWWLSNHAATMISLALIHNDIQHMTHDSQINQCYIQTVAISAWCPLLFICNLFTLFYHHVDRKLRFCLVVTFYFFKDMFGGGVVYWQAYLSISHGQSSICLC